MRMGSTKPFPGQRLLRFERNRVGLSSISNILDKPKNEVLGKFLDVPISQWHIDFDKSCLNVEFRVCPLTLIFLVANEVSD
jgi:hypothetical protein